MIFLLFLLACTPTQGTFRPSTRINDNCQIGDWLRVRSESKDLHCYKEYKGPAGLDGTLYRTGQLQCHPPSIEVENCNYWYYEPEQQMFFFALAACSAAFTIDFFLGTNSKTEVRSTPAIIRTDWQNKAEQLEKLVKKYEIKDNTIYSYNLQVPIATAHQYLTKTTKQYTYKDYCYAFTYHNGDGYSTVTGCSLQDAIDSLTPILEAYSKVLVDDIDYSYRPIRRPKYKPVWNIKLTLTSISKIKSYKLETIHQDKYTFLTQEDEDRFYAAVETEAALIAFRSDPKSDKAKSPTQLSISSHKATQRLLESV